MTAPDLDHGPNNCDYCNFPHIQLVYKIGKWYFCAECLRRMARELDRLYGK